MSTTADTNRRKLLQAAAELFAEKGYDATSTRDLCNKANVNVASISYYFGGKEGLYLAVFEQYANKLADGVKNIYADRQLDINSTDDLEKALDALISTFVRMHIEDPDMALILHAQNINQVPEARELFQKILMPVGEPIIDLLKRAQDKHIIRANINIHSFLTIIIQSIWGYMSAQDSTPALMQDAFKLPEQTEAFTHFLSQMFARGISECHPA